MVFILQGSRQRELKKKLTGIIPLTSISVLIFCNYPCMGRHTKKEGNMVLILKGLVILFGGWYSAPSVQQNHLGNLVEMQIPHTHTPTQTRDLAWPLKAWESVFLINNRTSDDG